MLSEWKEQERMGRWGRELWWVHPVHGEVRVEAETHVLPAAKALMADIRAAREREIKEQQEGRE